MPLKRTAARLVEPPRGRNQLRQLCHSTDVAQMCPVESKGNMASVIWPQADMWATEVLESHFFSPQPQDFLSERDPNATQRGTGKSTSFHNMVSERFIFQNSKCNKRQAKESPRRNLSIDTRAHKDQGAGPWVNTEKVLENRQRQEVESKT